jgi:hypothetical protein
MSTKLQARPPHSVTVGRNKCNCHKSSSSISTMLVESPPPPPHITSCAQAAMAIRGANATYVCSAEPCMLSSITTVTALQLGSGLEPSTTPLSVDTVIALGIEQSTES